MKQDDDDDSDSDDDDDVDLEELTEKNIQNEFEQSKANTMQIILQDLLKNGKQ